MDAKGLIDLAQRYKENRRFITNEETAKMFLVVPFLRLLGYETNNPREVRLEFCADFTQGDGKKHPDRMDYAIFDQKGERPLIVIEVKPLGTRLEERANQLARYIAQLPGLHFGIMTDGCQYRFYSDLENPNAMDKDPFFSFSLDDDKEDWARVADFLHRFGREQFNAETLVTDAENSRYRRNIIAKLSAALHEPGNDEEFMKWLAAGIYNGKKTTAVMQRLAAIAKEAVEPSLLKVLGSGIADTIRRRFSEENEPEEALATDVPAPATIDNEFGIVTTEEELEFHRIVMQICTRDGHLAEDILYKDTKGWFNVSYKRPTKFFLRFISRKSRREVYSLVPVEEARTLAPAYLVETPPPHLGASKLIITEVAELWALQRVILRSLQLMIEGKAQILPTAPADGA